MSVLGLKDVVQRIVEENLIGGLGGRDLSNPEGTGIDLRLGEVHRISKGGAFLNSDQGSELGKRKGVETELLAKFHEGQVEDVVIAAGQYYLVQTIETIKVPSDLMPVVYPRTSLFRSGLLLLANKADPGYSGPFTFGLANLSGFEVTLQMGARICNVVFHTIEGETVAYRGQHQGGRISFGEEKQV